MGEFASTEAQWCGAVGRLNIILSVRRARGAGHARTFAQHTVAIDRNTSLGIRLGDGIEGGNNVNPLADCQRVLKVSPRAESAGEVEDVGGDSVRARSS